MVIAGIDDPAADIAAITAAYRSNGIMQQGKKVALLWGKGEPVRGKQRWRVTTDLHVAQEGELLERVRQAAADRSTALSVQSLDRAVDAYLARNPGIDPTGAQWQAQRRVMQQLSQGGRVSVVIGVAGSGKTTLIGPLTDAWVADGRRVYGLALAWRQVSVLGEAGIKPEDRASIAAFMKRVETGRYLLDLVRLQGRHGFQLIAIGDPKQCQSVEAGPVIDMIQKALPGTVPALLTPIRQRSERERTIARHINALIDGSRGLHGFKNDVAESRHRQTTWMVVNEAADRRQIAESQPLGVPIDIGPSDIWANVAANLSRQPTKASAMDFLSQAAGLQRISHRYRGVEPHERPGRGRGTGSPDRPGHRPPAPRSDNPPLRNLCARSAATGRTPCR